MLVQRRVPGQGRGQRCWDYQQIDPEGVATRLGEVRLAKKLERIAARLRKEAMSGPALGALDSAYVAAELGIAPFPSEGAV